MSLPETLTSHLEDEDPVATVQLGGDDHLVVTASRTLVYRSEGLLSDESVEEYPHGAERLDVSEGRRKAKITFDYGLDGERTVSIPAKKIDDALHPVMAGTLNAAGITEAGESTLRTFRFSELTLVITSARVVKHIGAAVWDGDYEQFHYDDITDVQFEEGSVATSIVLRIGNRQERFKAPNEQARVVKETLIEAVCAHHDVASLEEFRLKVQPDEDTEPEPASDPTDFGEGLAPLSTDPAGDAEEAQTEAAGATSSADVGAENGTASGEGTTGQAMDSGAVDMDAADGRAGTDVETTETPAETGGAVETASETASVTDRGSDQGSDILDRGDSGTADATTEDDSFETEFEPAQAAEGDLGELIDEVEALRDTVDAQGEQLDRQSDLIEKLIEELRRGR